MLVDGIVDVCVECCLCTLMGLLIYVNITYIALIYLQYRFDIVSIYIYIYIYTCVCRSCVECLLVHV